MAKSVCYKVPKSDFQSQFSEPKIIWIYLKNGALFDSCFWPSYKSHVKINTYHFFNQGFNLKCFYQNPLTWWKNIIRARALLLLVAFCVWAPPVFDRLRQLFSSSFHPFFSVKMPHKSLKSLYSAKTHGANC